MRKLYTLSMLCLLSLAIASCGASYSFNPNYNKKVAILSHQQYNTIPATIVKTGSKQYLSIGKDEFRKIDGNKDTTYQLCEQKFKDGTIEYSRMIDNKLLVICNEKEEVTAYFLDPDKLTILQSAKIPAFSKYKIKDIKSSENNRFTSLLISDTDEEFIEVTFDDNLNIISENKFDKDKFLGDNDKYDFEKFIGHFVANDGKAYLSAPLYVDDSWISRNIIFSGNNAIMTIYDLPEKVNNRDVKKKKYEPTHSFYKELKVGSLLIASLITQNKKELQYIDLLVIDKNTGKKIKQSIYSMAEADARRIYDEECPEVQEISGIFENDQGELMLFLNGITFSNYTTTGSATGLSMGNLTLSYTPHTTYTTLIESKLLPILILDLNKDFSYKWRKLIIRDRTRNFSILPHTLIPDFIAENGISFIQQEGNILFTYPSDEQSDESTKNATYCFRSINFSGELSKPESLFESANFLSMIDGKMYPEVDGTFSYFTCYRKDFEEIFDYVNLKLK